MSSFVFISYKSDDRDLIAPYLGLLRENGIDYWWDQEITQDWSLEIDRKLEDCAVVLGFMTELSMQSDAVYAEFETGKSMGKLLPVKLDPCRPHYHFRTVIGSLSWINLFDSAPGRIEQEKRRLLASLRPRLEGVSPPPPGDLQGELEPGQWFLSKERHPHLAYAIALCVFEGSSHDLVQDCAAQLEVQFTSAGLDQTLGIGSSLVTRSRKLASLGASVISYRSQITGSAFDTVSYRSPGFAREAFVYAWQELDQIKRPIINWFNDLLGTRPAACVGDIAAALALVGRRDFQSLYGLILRPWLASPWTWQFLCADIALSLLMDDARIVRFVSGELLRVGMGEPEARQGDGGPAQMQEGATGLPVSDNPSGVGIAAPEVPEFSQELSRQSAIALVTGYAGMRRPELAVALFKRIDGSLLSESRRRMGATFAWIDKGIDQLLVRARTDPYAQSLLLPFASGIHSWITDASDARSTVLPEYIFLRLLAKMTIERVRGTQASLHDILVEAGAPDARAVDTVGRTIAAALECGSSSVRDAYIEWIKAWKRGIKERTDESSSMEDERAMERRLFTEIFDAARSHASSDNDVERIRFHTALS